jgi:uncharacterized membrane protein
LDVRPDDPQGLRVEAPQAVAAPIEPVVALVLRCGVFAATVLVVVGTAITFARHPDYRSSAEALRALLAPDTPRSPTALLASLSHLRGQGFVLAGLILLIATPIVRVAVTAVLLARRRERTLGAFGVGVLILLLASFAIGHAGP